MSASKPRKLVRFLIVAVVLLILALSVPIGFIVWLNVSQPSYEGVTSIELESAYQDEALLKRAWALPTASQYGSIHPQVNGSVCGPSSAANALRSVGDTETTEELVLEGTGLCRTGMCFAGLTLDELAGVIRTKTDRPVTVIRDISLDEFREHLRKSNDPSVRYLINFTRGPLFGRGGGHHSPIGGYIEELDLVFVLDTNDKYKPWLVSSERLYEAMNTVDTMAEKKRGLLLLGPAPKAGG